MKSEWWFSIGIGNEILYIAKWVNILFQKYKRNVLVMLFFVVVDLILEAYTRRGGSSKENKETSLSK